jgi:hypothetical protein
MTLLVFATTVSDQAAHGTGSGLLSADSTVVVDSSSTVDEQSIPTDARKMTETVPTTFVTTDLVMTRSSSKPRLDRRRLPHIPGQSGGDREAIATL